MESSRDSWSHDGRAGASLCRRRKRGEERNALGRSRGGFSTKINARTNAEGLPIAVVITPGQEHDLNAYPALMEEIDDDPEQLLGDKEEAASEMTPVQCREGRALVNMSIEDLASATVTSAKVVSDFEAELGLTKSADIDAMRTVLEEAGVEFIEDGVKLTKGGG
jgi:hypothetical protein